MKQVTTMSRLTNQLEKMFRILNAELFDNVLDTPVITVTPSSRSYAHYTPWDAWQTKDEHKREINIASGTLDRPLEAVAASLLHEMVHMFNDTVVGVFDTSRGGTYHNKYFKREAEKHGLLCTRTERYGWSRTEAGGALLELLCNHNELREIEMCRVNPLYTAVGIGTHSNSGGEIVPKVTASTSHSRKYTCTKCGNSVRATKSVNVICGDCMVKMVEV